MFLNEKLDKHSVDVKRYDVKFPYLLCKS